MTTEYNENSQELATTSQSDEQEVVERTQPDNAESVEEQEEELYFWSEPGVCG
ncbi:hypothetical protein [Leucothrix pacifica]|uniref:hypothetical protein n=1 Tax=Leucothrix pacifica TaxID=1247513 RepID=UPI0015E87737|nr:hypothetical protein [Leucothrix pacifica]